MKVKELLAKLINQDPEVEAVVYDAEWSDYDKVRDVEVVEVFKLPGGGISIAPFANNTEYTEKTNVVCIRG